MPVVRIFLERLNELVGEEIKLSELEDVVFSLKGEIENFDEQHKTIDIEFTMDRPDLLISEGIARAIKGLREIETGFPKLRIGNSSFELMIQSVPTRPFIAIGIIKNYELDEKALTELIQFQEKIHLTVGRKRKKVAIGIHDLDKIPHEKIEYKLVSVNQEMNPLGIDSKWSVKEVLQRTPQGLQYGSYSLIGDFHPAIISGDEIISLPPVINSNITRLDIGTKNLFIDVTGTDEFAVLKTLDLLMSILTERKEAFIELCQINRNQNKYFTPGLTPTYIETTREEINKTLGLELSSEEIIKLGEKMRWDVISDGFTVRAGAPEYRLDILHPIDFIEDIAMAYGYSNFPLKSKPVTTIPREEPYNLFKKVVKKILLGLGFTQISNFTMISEDTVRIIPEKNVSSIRIINPISNEMSHIRPSLIPSLLLTIKDSQKTGLPIRIFEIGYFGFIENQSNKLVSGEKIGLAFVDYRVGYEDIQAAVESLLSMLDIAHTYHRYEANLFIKGRSSVVKHKDSVLGFVGEIYPQILIDNQIKHHVAVAEFYLDKLFEIWKTHGISS